jgi:ComF family protein
VSSVEWGWRRRLAVAGQEVWDAAVELVFPMACIGCGRAVEKALFCPSCLVGVLDPPDRRRCGRCAMPIGPHAREDPGCSECRGVALGFDRAIVLGPYEGPLRECCLAIKTEPEVWRATWLAEMLHRERGEPLRAEAPSAVVAIPLHWRRAWRRGYNQSDLIAKRLARALRVPLLHPLRRARPTPKLAGLSRQARRDALINAFALRSPAGIAGSCVLLVDDILTTGSTAGAAARALKQGGASRVIVTAIARAEGPG